MGEITRPNRLDTALIAFIVLGMITLLSLSIISRLSKRASPSIDDGCGTESLPSRIATILKEKSRFIAVVGDGVPGESLVVERPYNTQFAQGYDLYQGVQHALQNKSFEGVLTKIGILNVDDGGNPSCAKRIADILADQPSLLGIIGHSTTSSTKEALPSYSKSNIPVVIPAATNPVLLSGNSKNCFRLPSNDLIQSLVIADIVTTKFNAKTVFIVWDATAEASQYSEYLKTTIQHYLSTEFSDPDTTPIIEGSYPISLNPLNYSYLFKRIVSSDPDVVIFSGYGSLAREFLFGLDYEYSQHVERARPKIILTDGCKIPTINSYNFETYVTFAAAPLNDQSFLPIFQGFHFGEKLGPFQKMYLEESFEVFGYDAAIILLTAISTLEGRDQGVSRQQIIKFISSESNNVRTAYPYSFVRGDNTRHRYYCYSLSQNAITFTYEEQAINALQQRVNTP